MSLLSSYLHSIRINKVKPYIKGDVLDLGCGPATHLNIARDQIKTYYGIDYDEKLITKDKKMYPDAKFFVKDLDEDKLNLDKKFDAILMVALIEHIFNQKFFFREVIKYLKPNGIIVITTPTPFGNDIVHRIGGKFGLFSKVAVDDHIVIYNKKRVEILTREFDLKITKYFTFEFGCNQLVILRKEK